MVQEKCLQGKFCQCDLIAKVFSDFVQFVRNLYGRDGYIPLHEPQFTGKEKRYVLETIESTFVSSVGQYVDKFEQEIAQYTGAQFAAVSYTHLTLPSTPYV